MNKPNCVNLVVLIPFAMNLTKHVWPQNQKRNKLNFVLKMSLLGLIIFHVVIFFIPSPIWYFLCFRTSNCRHHGACNKNMKTCCYLLHSAEKSVLWHYLWIYSMRNWQDKLQGCHKNSSIFWHEWSFPALYLRLPGQRKNEKKLYNSKCMILHWLLNRANSSCADWLLVLLRILMCQ